MKLETPMQRTALRMLAVFLVIMLLATVVSRAAEGITQPTVTLGTLERSTLTNRVIATGTIEPLDDLEIKLPAGIAVEKIFVEQGQSIEAGEPLAQLNFDDLNRRINKQRNEITLLEIRLENARQGISDEGSTAIMDAERAIEEAQENQTRALERGELKTARDAEDYSQMEENLRQAEASLARALEKVREDILKAAQEQITAAEENLEVVKENAAAANKSAEAQVTSNLNAIESANQQENAAESALAAAERAKKSAQTALDHAENTGDPIEIANAQAAYETASSQYDSAYSLFISAGNYYYQASKGYSTALQDREDAAAKGDERIKKAEEELKKTQEELKTEERRTDYSEEPEIVSAHANVKAAQQSLRSAQRASEDLETALLDEQRNADSNIEEAERNLALARQNADKAAIEQQRTDREKNAEILGYQIQLQEAREQLAMLQEAAQGSGTLTAPSSGTVLFSMTETGTTTEQQLLFRLSQADLGFQVKAKVSIDNAEKVAIGDNARLSYTTGGSKKELEANLAGFSAPDENKLVTLYFLLDDGDYTAGGQMDIELARKSDAFASTLPITALRQDSNGAFVLATREEQTVLGSTRTAIRVPVTVESRDTDRVAIISTLLVTDQVIVSANKPVSAGDHVQVVQNG